MITVKDIQEVYFIGIGGIGMSALARYFHALGKQVSGYDKTPTALTRTLESEGVSIHYQEDLSLIPTRPDLVVYTPAVPANHVELVHYQQQSVLVMKRSEVLGLISNSSFNICIAGTHGKTTTSSMTAHILRHSGYGCNAFLGGITVNYDTNFWSDPGNVAVIEADEYDRSFLKLFPDIAVISSMDPDHLDIYGTEEALQEAFVEFSRKLKPGGVLFSKLGLPRSVDLKGENHYSYSLQNDAADVYADGITMVNGSYEFSVVLPGDRIDSIKLNMGGMHNVENAVVSIAIAHKLGIDHARIRGAVESFQGVKRRFEYIIRTPELVYIDDYAHHPEELKALIRGAMALFPGRKTTVVFQPHLFSRTRDLAMQFSDSLDLADEVILLPIYPARELPIDGVNSEMIATRMSKAQVHLLDKEAVLHHLVAQMNQSKEEQSHQLLITAGAGDIDTLVQPLKSLLT